jgi:hypothetical protein
MLDPQILLALDIRPETGLNFPCSVFSTEHTISLIPHFSDKTLDLSLNHHQTLAFSPEFFPHRVTSPRSLNVNHEKFLSIGQNHVGIPSFIGINAE